MPIPLPTMRPNSDYKIYTHELRKNHEMARAGLEEVGSKSAELATKVNSGFYSYKELALGACNHPSVIAADRDKSFYKRIENVLPGEVEPFHRINAVLDAAIDLMKRVRPAPSPSEGRSITQNIHNTASATSTVSIEVEINTFVEKLNGQITNAATGSPEKTFLERLKDRLLKTKDIAAMLMYTLQAINDSGIAVEKARELLSKLM
jgi:hypothetical protein